MSALFDHRTVFFTALGYPMSYLEFFGTVLTLWSVWLLARNRILNWPVGIAGVTLFAVLFYQIRLYSDFAENIYFLLMSIYGWWRWLHPATAAEAAAPRELRITRNSPRANAAWAAGIAAASLLLGFVMTRIHLLAPRLFPEPAALPFLDAWTTVMSLAAMALQTRRKIENWVLWILVDVLAVGIYFFKGVKLVALLFLIFLGLATHGFLLWRRALRSETR